MLIHGQNVVVGQTVAFDYARRTKSGIRGRIGEVVEVRPNVGTIIIAERVNGQEQYRQFYGSAIQNLLVD